MKNRASIISIFLVILTTAVSVAAQERIKLGPTFKPDQQARYVITSQIDQVITPAGDDGISSRVQREFTATVLLRTVGVNGKGIITEEAIVEDISYRDLIDGKERPSGEGALIGKTIEITFTGHGNLLKASIPQQAADLGLVDVLVSLLRWFPTYDVSTDINWISTQPAIYSGGRSEIGRNLSTFYKLVSFDGNTAVVNGAITLDHNGSARVTTINGPLDVNAIGRG